MPSIRDNVEYLMSKYDKCRNDDKYLLMCYWRYIDEIKVRDTDWPEQFFEKGTPPASITRARALIQADGMYPPDTDVAIKRRQRESNMRDSIIEGEVI